MKIGYFLATIFCGMSIMLSAMKELPFPQYNEVNKQAVLAGTCEVEDYLLKSFLEEKYKSKNFNPEGIFPHIAKYAIDGDKRHQRQTFRKFHPIAVSNFIHFTEKYFMTGVVPAAAQCCVASLLLTGLLKYAGKSDASMKLLVPAGLSFAAYLMKAHEFPELRNSNKIRVMQYMPFYAGLSAALNIVPIISPRRVEREGYITSLGLNSLNPILAAMYGYSAYHLSGKPSWACSLLAAGQLGMFGNAIRNNAETIKNYFLCKKKAARKSES